MSRWKLWTVIIVLCVSLGIGIASILLERSARRAATNNGVERDFHKVTAEELNHEVRTELPLGSSRSLVENWLRSQQMKFSYDSSSRTIVARAPYLKGSGFPVSKSLILQMHFDDDAKLMSINSTIEITGP